MMREILKKDKDGNVKRSFRAPKEDDWGLLKTKTQTQIDESGQTVEPIFMIHCSVCLIRK